MSKAWVWERGFLLLLWSQPPFRRAIAPASPTPASTSPAFTGACADSSLEFRREEVGRCPSHIRVRGAPRKRDSLPGGPERQGRFRGKPGESVQGPGASPVLRSWAGRQGIRLWGVVLGRHPENSRVEASFWVPASAPTPVAKTSGLLGNSTQPRWASWAASRSSWRHSSRRFRRHGRAPRRPQPVAWVAGLASSTRSRRGRSRSRR